MTFISGSACSKNHPAMACPASWYATVFFSSGCRTWVFFSRPQTQTGRVQIPTQSGRQHVGHRRRYFHTGCSEPRYQKQSPISADMMSEMWALTSDDSLYGLFKVFLADGVWKVASGDQSRLVTDVSDVCAWQKTERRNPKREVTARLQLFHGEKSNSEFTWEPRCEGGHLPGQSFIVQVDLQLQRTQVNFKDGRPTFNIRRTWDTRTSLSLFICYINSLSDECSFPCFVKHAELNQ